MAASLEQFVDRISDSGLLSREDVQALMESLPAPKTPKDAQDLARELVRQKKLTKYQVRQVYAGKGKSLVLGNYTVLDKIGQGGMGMVLKAEHRRMKRQVAIKLLSPNVTKTPEALRRFQREVEAAAKLMHTNIVAAYDADESDGIRFLVMEHVEGKDLSLLVQENGPLPLDKALSCLIQAARGLEYAHKHGVVHRDIKPANMLLSHDGTVKILDMGLARLDTAGADQDQLTGTGQIMGTVDYMAPEQAVNTKTADARADIYSLGITLWYLLTGNVVYAGTGFIQKLMAHRLQPIPSLRAVCPQVSIELEAVFAKMIAKAPDDRYQKMTEVIGALQQSAVDDSSSAPPIGEPQDEDKKLRALLASMDSIAGPNVASKTKVKKKVKGELSEAPTVSKRNAEADTDPDAQKLLDRLIVSPEKPRRAGGLKRTAPDWLAEIPRSRVAMACAGVGGALVLLLAAIVVSWPSGEGEAPKAAKKRPALAVAPFDATQAKAHQKAWADYLGLPIEKEVDLGNGFKMTFMLIPPGEFMMGSSEDQIARYLKEAAPDSDELSDWLIRNEGPQHKVQISKGFYLATTEVTQGQWQTVMNSTPWEGSSDVREGADHAANYVIWEGATKYCLRLSEKNGRTYRLPTEAEWEYACRAGTTTAYGFGDDSSELKYYAWFQRNALDINEKFAHKVGLKRANGWGLYDMSGNVSEWCSDWSDDSFDNYSTSPGVDPIGPSSGFKHVIRGGSWETDAQRSRSAFRGRAWSGFFTGQNGFRVVCKLDTDVAEDGNITKANTNREVAEWVLGIGGTIDTEAGNFSEIGKLPETAFRITDIRLKGNRKVTDEGLMRLKGLTDLASLWLNDTQVSDEGLVHLKGLTNLTRLRLNKTQVSDEGLVHLQGLTNLTGLSLYATQVSDKGLEHLRGMTNLTELGLGKTQISDDGVHLKWLTNLTKLGLHDTQFSDKGLEHLRGMSNLTVLGISMTQVSDEGLAHLKGLTKLQELHIEQTKITARGIAEFKRAHPNCKIIGNGIPEVAPPDDNSSFWIVLFDGSDTNNWQLGPFANRAGVLVATEKGMAVSRDEYDNFELEFQWKITRGGNSGVYYRTPATVIGMGVEYQLLDNAGHRNGSNPMTEAGSLYNLAGVERDMTKTPGEWNDSRIVCCGTHVEHWMNGQLILSYDASRIGTDRRGHILLQGHTGTVSFREIRVRPIK